MAEDRAESRGGQDERMVQAGRVAIGSLFVVKTRVPFPSTKVIHNGNNLPRNHVS